jgi:hypothetical protein
MPATNVARLWTLAPTKSTNQLQSDPRRLPPFEAGGPTRDVMRRSYEPVSASQLIEMSDRDERYCAHGAIAER